jgi:hypothetical protein
MTLDDAVSEDHPVRVIDAFVGKSGLEGVGFSKVEALVVRRCVRCAPGQTQITLGIVVGGG